MDLSERWTIYVRRDDGTMFDAERQPPDLIRDYYREVAVEEVRPSITRGAVDPSEVERLQAEVDRLLLFTPDERAQTEIERLRADQQSYADTYARNMDRQRAEVGRLREAFRRVCSDNYSDGEGAMASYLRGVDEDAAALDEEDKG